MTKIVPFRRWSERVLEHAERAGRVVLTHDRDFGELAVRRGHGFVGIVYLQPGHISANVVMESKPAGTP